MIFNSLTYLLLLFLFVPTYWCLPRKPRLWLIFLTSLLFYGFWKVEFIPLILFSAVVDYSASKAIYKSQIEVHRKAYLFLSLAVNLGLLFYFKYFYFFVENAIDVFYFFGLSFSSPALEIILPLGISFYTFQTISYTVDVYRGHIKPEENFIVYACYVTFFPQLIAGPILRAREVIPQFLKRQNFLLNDIGQGLRWIIYGLFLKVVLADNIAPLVDEGFSQNIDSLSALDIWTLSFMFGFQIYFDFSAYSHIAIGSARLLGIKFPQNFNFPYLAHSPKDFWLRWHISLSSWIRDYLYLPLAGIPVKDNSKEGLAIAAQKVRYKPKRNLTLILFLSWSIMGLWHGANWTFVLWGIYHASFIAIYRIVSPVAKNWSPNISKFVGWTITLPIAMLSWIPFRSDSVIDAFSMWSKIFIMQEYSWLGMRENTYLAAFLILIGMIVSFLVRNWSYKQLVSTNFVLIFTRLSYESVFLAIIIGLTFIYLRSVEQFIYFQF